MKAPGGKTTNRSSSAKPPTIMGLTKAPPVTAQVAAATARNARASGSGVTDAFYVGRQGPAQRVGLPGGNARKSSIPWVLGSCAAEYAAALANPFTGPDTACIPDYPALMTRRARVWVKGTFTTTNDATSNGLGWIAAGPLLGGVNDQVAVRTNTATAAYAGINYASETAYNTNAEYATAVLGLGTGRIQFRTVAAGLRIRNVTAVLNRGGLVVGLHEPAHQDLNGFTITQMDGYKESGRMPCVGEEWITLLYRPVDTDDLDFASGFAVGNGNYMGFMIAAPSATQQQTFEFEYSAIYEYQGSIVTSKIPSHVDPVGHGAVNAITSVARKMHAPHVEDSAELAQAAMHASNHYAIMHTTGHVAEKKAAQAAPSKPWYEVMLDAAPGILGAIASFL